MGMRKDREFKITDYRLQIFFSVALILYTFFGTNNLSGQPIRIGVALPLFTDSEDERKKSLGSDILNGVNIALSEHNKNSSTGVTIDIKDTKKDPEICVDVFSELADNDSVKCILGPVYSSEFSEILEIGFINKIPIISPTATSDDLAETNDYIFQLNPSYKTRGRLMAQYLMKELSMKNFMVIYEQYYGTNFKGHFESEVKKLGGSILLSKPYNRNDKNINSIVGDILAKIRESDLFTNIANLNVTQRQKLESAGVRYSLIDSLLVQRTEVSIYYLLGKNARKIIDTLNIKPYQLKPETSKFIQGIIDAIYIPISNPAEIDLLVPELFSNGLNFFIAGTGDWNNEKSLDENKPYFKNFVFESEYYLDQSDPGLLELKEKMDNTKYRLNKSFLFGYDAMKLILSVIEAGNKTRQDIYEALKKVSSYDAIKSKISLDSRVNSELNILTYDDGIKLVKTHKLSK